MTNKTEEYTITPEEIVELIAHDQVLVLNKGIKNIILKMEEY